MSIKTRGQKSSSLFQTTDASRSRCQSLKVLSGGELLGINFMTLALIKFTLKNAFSLIAIKSLTLLLMIYSREAAL